MMPKHLLCPMHSFLLRTFFLFLPFCAVAQLQDGAFAPDFELQDLNGNTWHLYELLESGKHVILDFSATWCHPCWDYHETGTLNEAYTLYGPNGTNELMIFMIEGDEKTNVSCLYNLPDCSYSTQGDWTSGTLYPIINDDFIADVYEISGWPTHFHICPNKLINNTSQPSLETIEYFLQSCAEPVGQNNASIAAFTTYSGEFCRTITTTPTIEVQNLGQQNMERASASCYVNGELQSTTSWEGHVIPFDTFSLSFPEITIEEEATVMIRIDSVNGLTDDDISNNEVSAQFTPTLSSTENRLQLELKTNTLPKGVYWEVTNSDSAVLYKGGNPKVIGKEDDGGTYTSLNAVYNIWIPLPGDGCYKFSVYDANDANEGVDYYKIKGPTGEVIAQAPYVQSSKHVLFNIIQANHPIVNNGAINKVYGLPAYFCSPQEYSISIDLLNLGEDNITQAEIEILENNQLVSNVSWSGDITPGEQANIAFPALMFDTGKDIVIRIDSVNGSTDVYAYQNEWTIDLPRNISKEDTILMEFMVDPWAYENYWQLTNSSGDVLYSGGNTKVGPNGGGLMNASSNDPGAYMYGTLVQVEFQLPEIHDCYSFLLVDSYGNGLYTGAYVSFSEKKTGKLIYRKDYNYIPFFDEEEVVIEVDPKTVSVQPVSTIEEVLVYPNPNNGQFEISSRENIIKVELFTTFGQQVFSTLEFESNQLTDISSQPSGIYFLKLIAKDGREMVKKVVKQ
jgi:archaellum component FlaF (FlaF/FlaG flagellin family)